MLLTYTPPPIATTIRSPISSSAAIGAATSTISTYASRALTVNISTLSASEQALARTALANGPTSRRQFRGHHRRADHVQRRRMSGGRRPHEFELERAASSARRTSDLELMGYRYGPVTAIPIRPMSTKSATLSVSAMPAITTATPAILMTRASRTTPGRLDHVLLRPAGEHLFRRPGLHRQSILTPMVADILAMQRLYGLSTTTRTGDTTYGFNTNAGGVYDASLYPSGGVHDLRQRGIDTLDFSGSTGTDDQPQPGDLFEVNGRVGNVSIARGVMIENAIGGAAPIRLSATRANNVLTRQWRSRHVHRRRRGTTRSRPRPATTATASPTSAPATHRLQQCEPRAASAPRSRATR